LAPSARAAASLASSTSQARLDAQRLARAEDLYKKKFISSQALDEQRSNYARSLAKQREDEAKLAKTLVTAPFSGVAGLRQVSEGAFVAAGTDIARLDKIDVIKLDFRVPELYLSRLASGQPLRVAVDAYPDAQFSGQIYAIEPAVDEQTRTVQVRARVGVFQAQIGELDSRRQQILDRISQAEESLELLGEDLYQAREQEERRKLEWVVEREVSPVPRRAQVMAWARGSDDDQRFRKALAASLAASLLLGALLPMIDLPLPKRFEAADVPKRLAQLVREEQAKPLPPPVVAEVPPEAKPQEQKAKPLEEPKPTEQRNDQPKDTPALAAAEQPPGAPQKKVEKAGILAFRDKFAGLAQDKTAPRLGKDARFSDADDASSEPTSRSMLTSNAPGSSGGINLAALSRNAGGGGSGGGGGGGGGQMQGVQAGRVTSSIGGGGGAGGLSIAGGVTAFGGLSLAMGGTGGEGNTAGNVMVNNSGRIETKDEYSYGIYSLHEHVLPRHELRHVGYEHYKQYLHQVPWHTNSDG